MPQPPASPDLENTLCRELARQSAEYEQALQVLERLAVPLQQGGDPTAALVELQRTLDRLASHDRHTSDLGRQFQSLRRRAGPQLQSVLENTQRRLEQLMARADQLEQQTRSLRDHLLPVLDQQVRGQLMRRAYLSAAGGR